MLSNVRIWCPVGGGHLSGGGGHVSTCNQASKASPDVAVTAVAASLEGPLRTARSAVARALSMWLKRREVPPSSSAQEVASKVADDILSTSACHLACAILTAGPGPPPYGEKRSSAMASSHSSHSSHSYPVVSQEVQSSAASGSGSGPRCGSGSNSGVDEAEACDLREILLGGGTSEAAVRTLLQLLLHWHPSASGGTVGGRGGADDAAAAAGLGGGGRLPFPPAVTGTWSSLVAWWLLRVTAAVNGGGRGSTEGGQSLASSSVARVANHPGQGPSVESAGGAIRPPEFNGDAKSSEGATKTTTGGMLTNGSKDTAAGQHSTRSSVMSFLDRACRGCAVLSGSGRRGGGGSPMYVLARAAAACRLHAPAASSAHG